MLCCTALCLLASANGQSANNNIEELVVTGKRPGPKLWKVQLNNNVLWVMGIVQPLPKSLNWDDASVKHAIEQSAVFLTPPAISVSVTNPLKFIGLFRQYKKRQKLPKNTTIFDVLSTDRQQRYNNILDKYDIKINKKLRPLFIVEQLNKKASKRVGLQSAENIHKRLFKLAKSHNVNVISSTRDMDAKQALKTLESITLKDELSCFDATLKKLDLSVNLAINAARAWADGDHDELTKIALQNNDSSCADALLSSDQAVTAKADSKSRWLSQAQKALETNKVSFAYLPITEVVSSDGLIATLKRRLNDPAHNAKQ